MSARNVCSGRRPCKYHSERAISFPFNRPETRTLIPLQPQRRVHAFSHCPAEADPLLQLQRDILRNQLRVQLRLVHLDDVDEHVAAGALAQLRLELFDLGALSADHNARTSGADKEAQIVDRPLDLYRADTSSLQLLAQL